MTNRMRKKRKYLTADAVKLFCNNFIIAAPLIS
jgi:hypothetical protein